MLLISYIFHKFNERVLHFINNCIFFDPDIDFLIICNDKSKNYDNYFPNFVTIIYRDNIGFDFGGWSEGILMNERYKKYNKFIFLNSSVVGPYISKSTSKKWTDIYLEGLNDDVKLFGSTINILGENDSKTHVQSYIFSLDLHTLEFLIEKHIFSLSNMALTFNDCIQNKEIQMSRYIIDNNWNIGCLVKCYTNIDFRKNRIHAPIKGDIMYKKFKNVFWFISKL
jgi:hypothetical protein